MRRCTSDIETDGLLDELEQMYCGCTLDVNSETVFTYRDVHSYLERLNTYDEAVFHNGINFDYPALAKLTGNPNPIDKSKIVDTLVLSRLIYPDLAKIDAKHRRMKGDSYTLPPKLTGSHSLAAWGHRLGDYKGDFDPANYENPETGEPHTWKTVGFSQDMLDYNIQDDWVTLGLLRVLEKRNYSPQAVKLEHDTAWLVSQIERNGFFFNVNDAVELYAELLAKKQRLTVELKETFGWWYASNGRTKPKRTIHYKEVLRGDLTEGATYTKLKVVEFNPGSRKHVARCFKKLYGWVPTEYTDGGEPQLDAEILGKLDFKEAPMLAEYYDVAKMLGQLGDGKNAWLKLETDGFIYGSINPNGAATGRASHSKPNVAQVPKGPEGSYGHRCRKLFTVPPGWGLLGTDASGLELRCLGNALYKYDKGAYIEHILNGDIHWVNVLALGLVPPGTERDKSNPFHEEVRDKAKTWMYAFLYGAGDELLGEAIGFTEEDRVRWREARAHLPVIRQLRLRKQVVTRARVCNTLKGSELRKSFLKAIPAVAKFQKWCKDQHKDHKGITGLDGRFIPTSSAHSATNYKLQCDGALVCKLWGVNIEAKLQALGLKHGWDGDYAFCAWVHDEYQIAYRTPEIAEIIGKVAREAIVEAGSTFSFNCPLDADYDVGKTWAETH